MYSRIRPQKFVPVLFVAWHTLVSLQTPGLYDVTLIQAECELLSPSPMNGIYHIPQLAIDGLYNSKTASDSIFKVKVQFLDFAAKMFLPFKM